MANKETIKRKVVRLGNSIAVTLPFRAKYRLGLDIGDEVEFSDLKKVGSESKENAPLVSSVTEDLLNGNPLNSPESFVVA